MANIPEGAQRSEDGHYWWDGEQWQLIEQDGGGDERVTARLASGLPASADDLTDEQKRQLLGEPTVHTEVLEHGEAEVLAMADHNDNGEALA